MRQAARASRGRAVLHGGTLAIGATASRAASDASLWQDLAMLQRPTVVLIGGWSWHRHVGDDAVLRAHLGELDRGLPGHDIRVVCAEPDRLARRMGVDSLWSAAPAIAQQLGPGLTHDEVRSEHLLPVVDEVVARALGPRAGELPHLAPLVDAIRRADAVVAASAGSLTAAYPHTVAEQVVVLRVAQAVGTPTVVSGASLGPFDGSADEDLLRPALAGADLVSVRDATVSPPLAARLGVAGDRLRVQHDPAFWMAPGADDRELAAALRGVGVDHASELALLTVSQWPGGADQVAPFAAVVDAVAAATGIGFVGVPMFVPPSRPDDLAIDAVRERLADPRRLVRLDPLPDDPDLVALSGRARVVVGSRFHGAVMAAAAGTPAVLVHDGAYQRNKAESLAASVDGVSAVALAAGPEAIATRVGEQLSERPAPLIPDRPLPAVEWLAERLRRPPTPRRRLRRWSLRPRARRAQEAP